VDSLIATLPAAHLEPAEATRFAHGNPVAASVSLTGTLRVYARTQGETRLLGVGHIKPDGKLWPRRLVANA
jgi:hypothetical protein